MNPSINIIEFQPEYSSGIIDLILDIQNNEFQVGFALDAQPDIANIHNFYIKPGGNFLLALCGNEVLGTIGALKISESDYAIRKMFVRKDYRGSTHKIAQRLLDSLISSLQSKDAHMTYLGTINKYQAAIRFYTKNGFEQIDKKDLPKYFPVAKVDNLFFQQQIEHKTPT